VQKKSQLHASAAPRSCAASIFSLVKKTLRILAKFLGTKDALRRGRIVYMAAKIPAKPYAVESSVQLSSNIWYPKASRAFSHGRRKFIDARLLSEIDKTLHRSAYRAVR